MRSSHRCSIGSVAAWIVGVAVAQSSSSSCSTTLSASYAAPSIKAPYQFRLVATELTAPRGIIFDSNGNLLVVEQRSGIVHVPLSGDGDCVTGGTTTTVINNAGLNHGIAFSSDGRTLYASTDNDVFSWEYDPQRIRNTSGPTQLVTNMTNDDHTTRTLLIPNHVDDLILVSRGSTSNIDAEAASLSSGHSQIRAFNLANRTDSAYNYFSDGLRLGWGLRNSVGVAEEPTTGGIYSVENSVDEISRDSRDIHEDNPAEEMNFHGYLNGTRYEQQGTNYGYPNCVTAWRPDLLPNNDNIIVGTQFKLDDFSTTDEECRNDFTPPRLAFQAHMAPLDLKFNQDGTAAWVSFHGSWDRTDPVGYKLSAIEFADGSPTAAANSSTAAIDIMMNDDNSACPDGCFRPVGLAWDDQGRLFMSSDATGEIYMITRTDGTPTNGSLPDVVRNAPSVTTSGGRTSSSSGSGSAASSSSSGAAVATMIPAQQVALGVGLGLGVWNWV